MGVKFCICACRLRFLMPCAQTQIMRKQGNAMCHSVCVCLPAWLLQLYEKFSKSRVHSANSVHIHYYCHNNAWCWWWYAIHVRRGFFFAVSTHRNDIFHWLVSAPKPAKEPAILYSIHILIANRMNRALDQLDELCVWPLKFYEIEICFIPMD